MIAFALKGLLGRKLRTALTAFAIVLGVAMVSGTYVLTDSIDKAFDSIFTDVREGSTAVITGKSAFDLSEGSGASDPVFDESLLDEVRAGAGRRRGRGKRRRRGPADRRGRQGDRLRRRAESRLQHRRRRLGLQPARRSSRATWPGPGEVVIDKSTADKEDFAVGQEVGVQGDGPVERLRISGIVTFGSVSTIGGATLAGFDLPTAQRLFDKEGKLDEIAVAAKAGTSGRRARARARGRSPGRHRGAARVRAGRGGRGRDERVHHLPPGLPARLRRDRALRRQLRDRELALDHDRAAHARVRDDPDARRLAPPGARLDRARGARRRRARVDRRPASPGSRSRRASSGSSTPSASRCPNQGLLLETRTIVVSLLVGILVTLLASLRPAIRATRVPPIAAVREGATLPESRFARFRTAGLARR